MEGFAEVSREYFRSIVCFLCCQSMKPSHRKKEKWHMNARVAVPYNLVVSSCAIFPKQFATIVEIN